MRVKVSVCIPVYGVEKYIERCARSLFEQTMQDGIEFIFVNDCTPDKSIVVLERVLAEYPHRKEQTKIINLPENGGVAKARRIAIENCTGEYIIHCDPDDWVELDMYEKMYKAAKDADADMVYCDYVKELPDNTIRKYSGGEATTAIELQNEMLARKTLGTLWNRLYRRRIAIADYSEVCPDSIAFREDLLRNLFMLNQTKKITKLNIPLYHYRTNNTSITMTKGIHLAQGAWNSQVIIEKYFQGDTYKDSINCTRHNALMHILHYNYLPAKQFHAFRKKCRKMWKNKNHSIQGKFLFYLSGISYPLAGYLYRKIKGIKQ